MISISTYKQFMNPILDNIQADEIIYVVSQTHIVKKIKDKAGIILVFTYPKAKSDSDTVDNIQEKNECFAFILKKHTDDVTEDEEINNYETLQEIARQAKQWLIDKRYDFENEIGVLEVKSFNTEPEYRIFGGYSGWSIGFEIEDYQL